MSAKPKTLPKVVTCYSYQRYSSDAQADGDSVRRQTKLREEWLKRNLGVRLDTSLMLDARVSAFRGEHRTNGKHALGTFVDQVERGRVPAGSILLCESLDRLTQEAPMVAIPAVLRLIERGVVVISLSPTELRFDPDMEQQQLMMLLWELSRGHQESKMKSIRVSEAWGEKKTAARGGKPMGNIAPAWVELSEDGKKYVLRPKAAEAVRLIFRYAAEGLGMVGIAKRLTQEKVPPIGKSGKWIHSYIQLILRDRRTCGMYQPMKGHGRGRVPDGEPVPDYFPRVVSDTEWTAARAAVGVRTDRHSITYRGPKGTAVFGGMLTYALTGGRMYVKVARGRRYFFDSKPYYEGASGDRGAGSFPEDVLTDALLKLMSELRSDELFKDPGAAKVSELTARIAEVERRLVVALAKHEADPESTTWQAQVDKVDLEKRALVQDLADARQEASSNLPEAWADAAALMVNREPERLRAALRRTIEDVRVLVARRSRSRVAMVQVYFVGGAHRAYVIAWRPSFVLPTARRDDQWTAVSLDSGSMSPPAKRFDLKRPDHVKAATDWLSDFDIDAALDAADAPPARKRKGVRR
jgi:DNA invertase Pin-like site-specific DNA recombinase